MPCLGIVQVSVVSYHMALHRCIEYVYLHKLEALILMMDHDSVTNEPHLEPRPSVVQQCRSVSVQHRSTGISAIAGAGKRVFGAR